MMSKLFSLEELENKVSRDEILKKLCEQTEFSNGITAELMFAPQFVNADVAAGISPFYVLTKHVDGIVILDLLFKQRPDLIDALTAEILSYLNTTEGLFKNSSALYWLTSSEEGRGLLDFIFEKNPRIIHHLHGSVLSVALDAKAGYFANTSALYWLTSTPDGLDILNLFIEQNPKLLKEISAKTFYLRATHDEENSLNLSPFSWLSISSGGLFILELMFKQNIRLIKALTADDLCTPLTAKGEYSTYSPLFWFAALSEDLEILELIIEHNPELIQGISAEALCLQIAETVQEDAHTSPLYWLAKHEKGQKNLQNILMQNPGIIQELSRDSLCFLLSANALENENTSILYWLSSSIEGVKILKLIFSQNPELLYGFTKESLFALRSDAAEEHQNLSIFGNLLQIDIDFVLMIFLHNIDLINGVTPEVLYSFFYNFEEEEFLKNITAFSLLALFSKGHELLKHIFLFNPDLIQYLTIDILTTPISKTSCVSSQSPFYGLSKTLEGTYLIEKIIHYKPILIQELTAEILNVPKSDGSGIGKSCSSFYSLTQSKKGIEILHTLFSQNIELIKGVSIEILSTDFGTKPNSSIFYALSCNEDGHKFLVMLLELRPEFGNVLHEQILLENIVNPCKESEDSMSSNLERTEPGRFLKEKLLTRTSYPGLFFTSSISEKPPELQSSCDL